MLNWDEPKGRLVGPKGELAVLPDDEVTRKLLMLIEGQCFGAGGTAAAAKYGFSKPRYFQLLNAYKLHGAEGLRNAKRGPKGPTRRTDEVVRQVIRHRYLDPDVTAEVIAQKLRQCRLPISTRSVRRVLEGFGLQKKLYANRPGDVPLPIEKHSSRERIDTQPWDERRVEREVRQLLANKVMGVKMGLWLLVPEHLRLGTWDLLGGWIRHAGGSLPRRLAMQMIHESALCLTGMRQQRCLNHTGFGLVNGLPFVATDVALHHLLDDQTIQQAQGLQIALGRIRQSLGHFAGELLAIDPHRLVSHSQRDMRLRKAHPTDRAAKMTQVFFCLDAQTRQPVCCTLPTPGQNVAAASPQLLNMAGQILPSTRRALALCDTEHFTVELLQQVRRDGRFQMLVPVPQQPYLRRRLQEIPADQFTPRWAG